MQAWARETEIAIEKVNTSLQRSSNAATSDSAVQGDRPSLGWMVLRFLKIGTIGFGGGMAVISLMERECLRKHRCVEAEEFLHGVGLGQILGPFATNAALFIGYRMHGPVGGLLAAGAFTFPSVAIVIALSWAYVRFHHLPSLQTALSGIDPVVVALILSSAVSIGRKALRSPLTWSIAVASVAASLARLHPIVVLGTAGLLGLLLKPGAGNPNLSSGNRLAVVVPPLSTATVAGASTVAVGVGSVSSVTLGAITWTFLKVGFVFFGGGFVLVPILHERLINALGWLTPEEFVDGVAISQLTPGPIAVLATFAGFRVAGFWGAILATAALFTPAIVLMLVISRYYARLRNEQRVKDFLAGIVPAVVGLVVAAGVVLLPGSISVQHPVTIALGGLAFLALVTWRWHPAVLLMIGAAVGIIVPSWVR